MDNSELARWRGLDAHVALCALADYAKKDPTFVPSSNLASTRWHASVAGRDFELVCTGSKFFDTRAASGGGGAVDLAKHLFAVSFKAAVGLLRLKGL